MARTKKSAPEKAAEEKAEVKAPEVAETPAAEEKAPVERQWMNRVPASFIHPTKTKLGVSTISIPDSASSTGYGSIFVKDTQVIDAKSRQDGTPLPNLRNVNLGNPNREVDYTIAVGKDDEGKTKYETTKISAKEVAEKFAEGQKAYFAERAKESKTAEPAKENEAEAEAEV